MAHKWQVEMFVIWIDINLDQHWHWFDFSRFSIVFVFFSTKIPLLSWIQVIFLCWWHFVGTSSSIFRAEYFEALGRTTIIFIRNCSSSWRITSKLANNLCCKRKVFSHLRRCRVRCCNPVPFLYWLFFFFLCVCGWPKPNSYYVGFFFSLQCMGQTFL